MCLPLSAGAMYHKELARQLADWLPPVGAMHTLDPGLKAPAFKKFNLVKEKLAFRLEPGFSERELAREGACAATPRC